MDVATSPSGRRRTFEAELSGIEGEGQIYGAAAAFGERTLKGNLCRRERLGDDEVVSVEEA